MSAVADVTSAETPQERMPPGPGLPRALQTAGFIFGGPRFLEACRRRFGNAVTFGTLFDSRFVMVFDPALVKEVFQGSPDNLHAGEANALLGPILGERSVLLLDGAEHLRHRRLMLPPFHGRRLAAYEDVIRAVTDDEIDRWPVGEEFALLGSMQALTLRVIMQVVFGYDPGPAQDELREALRAMIEPVARPRGLLLMLTLGRLGGLNRNAATRFERTRRHVDELLRAEIARRREDPELDRREDIFSMLLLARDEQGAGLTDTEIRDELVTLLLAGHETTATGLAWTFDLLLHDRRVLNRIRRERSTEYVDAVVKEALRVRPVIPGVGRVVRGEPFRLGPWVIPPGVEINPSIRMIHRRRDMYADPGAFRPERFLGPDAPDTYTWVPFGGGTRRCIGASFAQMEMRVVVTRVLERARLRAANEDPEEVQFRAITLVPKTGTRVVQEVPPVAVLAASAAPTAPEPAGA